MPFRFTREPFRTAYLLLFIPILFLRYSYWTFSLLPPSRRPRRSWTVVRSLIIRLLQTFSEVLYEIGFGIVKPSLKEPKPATRELLGFVWVPQVAKGRVTGEIEVLADKNGVEIQTRVPGYWHGARSAGGVFGLRAKEDEKVFYMLHCGGYVMDTAGPGGQSAIATRGILAQHIPFARAFSVEYRLASTTPFKRANAWPAALIDAIAGYDYLLSLGFAPADILIGGDSSGGNLTLALTRYLLRSSPPSLAPAGLLLLSPTVDWTLTHRGPNSSWETCQSSDFCVPVFKSGFTVNALRSSLTVEEFERDPYLCPGSLALASPAGLFANFPRTLVIAGDAELQVDAIRTVVARMKSDLGEKKVEYVEIEDMTHDVLVLEWYEPERGRALRAVEKWTQELWE